jgi:hypothetical protein
MRLVQGCRVDDAAHARHAVPDEIPIADRADAIGEWRWLDVDSACRPMRGTQAPHQRLAEVPGTPGYEDRHGRSARLLLRFSSQQRIADTPRNEVSTCFFAAGPNSKRVLATPFVMEGKQDT